MELCLARLTLIGSMVCSGFLVCGGDANISTGKILSQISFNPREINAQTAEHLLTFNLAKPANLKITIYDWDGEEITSSEVKGNAGKNDIVLKDLSKKITFDGVCLFVIEARSDDGEKDVYGPGLRSGLLHLRIDETHIRFDEDGKLSFVMPQIGMARVRLFRDTMAVRTLMNWTPLLAGRKSFVWDGKDQSGNDVSKKEIHGRINAYSLPENAIVSTGKDKEKPARRAEDQLKWRNNPALATKYFSARMPREISRDPQISLETLASKDGELLPNPLVITEPIKVRINANPEDTSFMTDERFEVCVYLDGVLLFEDEDGVIPFTFDFNPAGLNHGAHLLTVVLITTADHIGAASISVQIGKLLQSNHKK